VVFWGVWFLGWLLAFVAGLVFRKTLFRGESSPFVMELPPYRLPTLRGVVTHMWDRGWMYVRKAGTIILSISVIMWFLLYFPKPAEYSKDYDTLRQTVQTEYQQNTEAQRPIRDIVDDKPATEFQTPSKLDYESQRDKQLALLDAQQAAEEIDASIAGRIGHAMEPVFSLAGFDWKLNIGLFAGFVAKEVLVSTMAIVYGISDGSNAETESLKSRLIADPHYTPATALALMVFALIYAPCLAVQAVIRKELGSWKWSALSLGYTVTLAWVLAVLVYQGAQLAGLG
jgi:ferrous iron transport protein B